MRKFTFVISTIIFICLNIRAQELPLFSQYTLNPYLINPSIAGIAGCGIVQGVSRTQWSGITDAPRTYALSYHQGFSQVGLGSNIYNDKNGLSNNLGIELTFAYHLFKQNISDSKRQLSFGISFCTRQRSIDEGMFTPVEGDPLVNGAVEKAFTINSNAGMYFINRDFFAGLSCAGLFPVNNSISGSKAEPTKLRHYFLQAGYTFFLKQEFALEPSLLLKATEVLNKQIDMNVKFYYYNTEENRFWLALSYRRNIDNNFGKGNSIMPIIGFNNSLFCLAYAYDCALTPIGSYNSGSHEVMIGYYFCRSKKSKSTCPAYGSPKKWEKY